MPEKNRFWLLLLLLCGAVVGGMVGENLKAAVPAGPVTDFFTRSYPLVDVPPMEVDLFICKLSMGFSFSPNLLAVLGMILGAVVYHKF